MQSVIQTVSAGATRPAHTAVSNAVATAIVIAKFADSSELAEYSAFGNDTFPSVQLIDSTLQLHPEPVQIFFTLPPQAQCLGE